MLVTGDGNSIQSLIAIQIGLLMQYNLKIWIEFGTQTSLGFCSSRGRRDESNVQQLRAGKNIRNQFCFSRRHWENDVGFWG